MHVRGSADASILPTPSLTFTDVTVGAGDKPMMSVDRFAMTVELMPLLQGQIRVVSMKLERPQIRISVDGDGGIDWLRRSDESRTLDSDKVVLEDVEIDDGTVSYSDARASRAMNFEHVKATIEARSLAGPWRIDDGSFQLDGGPVSFRLATGRQLDDGSIRIKADVTPANAGWTVGTDGMVAVADGGLSYKGTYGLQGLGAPPAADQTQGAGTADIAGAAAAWHNEGSFTLTRDKLVVDKAVLTIGPPERAYSLAGSGSVDLGPKPSFDAEIQARQVDLDRSLGKGPSEPVEVSIAATRLVDWLSTMKVPGIPGRLALSVPAVVVGGAIIQDLGFEAVTAPGGWHIAGLHARLPGLTTLDADGVLSIDKGIGFQGNTRFSVSQPASFAAWWRGKGDSGAGRLLAPFSVLGNTVIAPGRLAVDGMEATIGSSNLSGHFDWTEARSGGRERHLETDLKADRLDFVQVRALADLLLGADPVALAFGGAGRDKAASADSYKIKFSAGALTVEDVTMRGVAIDASYADQALVVDQFAINDLGGARLNISKGRIDRLSDQPLGHLDGHLEASTLTGLAKVVERFAPGSGVSRWLTAAAPALVPAVIDASIAAPPPEGGADLSIKVKGVAAATTFAATIGLAGKPIDWQKGRTDLTVSLDTPDAAGLARQAAIPAQAIDDAGAAHLAFSASGVPVEGLTAKLSGNFGGLDLTTTGKLALPADAAPTFAGTIQLASPSIDPLIKMAGLSVPGAAIGTSVKLDGKIATTGQAISLDWKDGAIGERQVGGKLQLTRAADGGFEIGGDLAADSVDLGWVASLGLGFAPIPTGDSAVPWSKAPFVEPGFGSLRGRVGVTATELEITDTFNIANAAFDLGLAPNQVEFDLRAGETAGGTFAGGFTIHNVGGDANLTGHLELKGAALENFLWQRAGRAVATGTLDVGGDFEATGRSPAALVASLTGGGTITIRDGEVRNLNPQAANLIVRSSDLGQPFTDATLADELNRDLDGGTISFKQVDSAFAVAAGTIRLKSMSIAADTTKIVGSAAIDLNTFGLDSDWTLVLDPGDRKVEGAVPQVGLVFRGPLAAPNRTIDVLQFGSYLSIRQEERIQEILSLEEAARLEKERLNRLVRKLRQDAARHDREVADAAAAEAVRRAAAAAAAAKLDAFHVAGESLDESRAAAAATAFAAAEAARRDAAAKAEAAAEATRHDAAVKALTRLEALHARREALADQRGGALTFPNGDGALTPVVGASPPAPPPNRRPPPPLRITPTLPAQPGPMILTPQ